MTARDESARAAGSRICPGFEGDQCDLPVWNNTHMCQRHYRRELRRRHGQQPVRLLWGRMAEVYGEKRLIKSMDGSP